MYLTLLEATRITGMVTRCLIKDDDGFFYYAHTCMTVSECQKLGSEDLRYSLNRKGVDPRSLWPDCAEGWKRAVIGAEGDPTLFIKRPQLLDDVSFVTHPGYHPRLIAREVTVCEILLKHPHPNLAAYHGVVTDKSNRVTGIAYTRYDTDLLEYIVEEKPLCTKHVMSSISAALVHLHSLGLVHCDIRPPNIFIKGEGKGMQVVLGDFDATYRLGENITGKYGAEPFWPNEYRAGAEVKIDIDNQMLKNLELWLSNNV